MAVPPGVGLGVRHLDRAVAALSPGAALPHAQPDLDPDALALGNGCARGAKLRAHRAHGAGAADDRDRVRGWPLLQPSRHRLARAARAAGGRRRHQRGAGGLHHHPADGQEPVPVAGAQFRAQSAGAAARALARLRAAQTACARNLSQHRGVGSERAIRRRGRQPLRLPQIRALARPARGGVAGGSAAEPAAAQRQAAGAGGAPARLDLRDPRRGPGGAGLLRAIRQIIKVLASSPLELEFSLAKARVERAPWDRVVTSALWRGAARRERGAGRLRPSGYGPVRRLLPGTTGSALCPQKSCRRVGTKAPLSYSQHKARDRTVGPGEVRRSIVMRRLPVISLDPMKFLQAFAAGYPASRPYGWDRLGARSQAALALSSCDSHVRTSA